MTRPTAYGYIRVSTDEQARRGLGLAAQRRVIESYYRSVLARGYAWGGMIAEEGVSARKKRLFSRPGGSRLAERVQPGDIVLASMLDRIWRRMADFAATMEAWAPRGIHVHALDVGHVDLATSSGYLTAGVHVLMAESEGLRFGERIRAAHDERRRAGRKTSGTTAVGWTADRKKRVRPCPRERKICRRIVRLMYSGWTTRQIADRLTVERVQARGGNYWRPESVRRWARAAELQFPLTGYSGRTKR